MSGHRAPRSEDPEIEELRARLREAEETLAAISAGDVDAIVVGGPLGQQVYTLENADKPYRALIEQMQEGAVTLSPQGAILYCNERFAALAGLPREALIGSNVARFFLGEDRTRFDALLSAVDAAAAVAELRLRRSDGREVPVNLSLARLVLDEATPGVVSAVVTDLSQIKRRSEELSTANANLATEIEERGRVQENLQLALDAAGMGSWDLDLSRNAFNRSPRHDALFGHAEMAPQWTLDMAVEHVLPDDRPRVRDAFAATLQTGTLDVEARIRRADDGSVRVLHMTGKTFYENGAPVRIAGVVADVTDRRAVEERLHQAQKLEAMGQLTGGVAHDFNNLLMVVSSGLDLMDLEEGESGRIRAAMRQAVERGGRLSRQLLAFSRRQALQPEPIDLLRQIGGMQDLLDRSLRGDIHVRTELDANLWPVEVDPGELELAILNLAVNARDAMPDGGTITIRGVNRPNLVDAELRGDFVSLSVIDTGSGMPPDVMARVFEPFFTTKEIGKGSGLGLAQTHGFVLASGGAVRIDSTPGTGTEIRLLLPRTTKTPAATDDSDAQPAPTRTPSDGPAAQVLLVEDDDEVAALTLEMIGRLGFGAIRVAGPEAALGALADGRPIDLVFSDVMMPGPMNGVGLARAIRQRRPGLPVLLTSGYPEAARADAEAEGVRILAKPYRLDDLAHAFEALRPAG
jgi:PAS domain S-box-containing protein